MAFLRLGYKRTVTSFVVLSCALSRVTCPKRSMLPWWGRGDTHVAWWGVEALSPTVLEGVEPGYNNARELGSESFSPSWDLG